MHVVILAAAKYPLKQPFAGGLESLTWALVRGLRLRGIDVTLFAGPGSDEGSTLGRSPWHRWSSATPPERTRPCRPSNG